MLFFFVNFQIPGVPFLRKYDIINYKDEREIEEELR